jgi:predicted nucleic acid-binding protein
VEELVVDASVVVKWFIVEEDRQAALRIRDDYIEGKLTLSAPSLMPFEVMNAVRYARRDIEAERLREIAESLSLYRIRLYNLREEYVWKTIRTALDNDISIYDASYVALAGQLQTTLYTADLDLISSLQKEPKAHAKHISDYA